MAKKSATLLHEWFAKVWNKRNTRVIDQLAATDVIIHGLVDAQGIEVRGLKSVQGVSQRVREGFSRYRCGSGRRDL